MAPKPQLRLIISKKHNEENSLRFSESLFLITWSILWWEQVLLGVKLEKTQILVGLLFREAEIFNK